MAVLRKRGYRVHRPVFRASVRLNPQRITDLRGRGRIRGRSLRSYAHVRHFR